MCYLSRDRSGFTLLEILFAVAVFVIFAVGIYTGIQFIFKVVFQSRLRIVETGILNEQVEIIRNMPFHTVGIVNGSPPGLLERTVTTTRNGIEFTITRTIRNIDDSFDGTVDGQFVGTGECQGSLIPVCHSNGTLCVSTSAVDGHTGHGDVLGSCVGSPGVDNSPADYKLVEIEIICSECNQNFPVSLSTKVAPKFLEGDPNNGALFVEVFDANADPVQGAEVHILATSTNPTYDFSDTTGNDGFLRVVDLPAGLGVYHITVTKAGYTTDKTVTSSVSIPNPVRPPSSVVAQDVTQISFSIDQVSSLAIQTMDQFCQVAGDVPINLLGTQLIGTNPDVFKFDLNITTDGLGDYDVNDLAWDSYGLRVLGFDFMGSIPGLPINLLPNMTQPVQLLVGSDTANSLVVNVQDSINNQPLSNAIVHVTGSNFDETKTTGVGHIRQTDWSTGNGQEIMGNLAKYWSDNGNIDVVTSEGDVTLRQVGQVYANYGELTSSIFDLGTSPNYVTLI
jgi:prepilin-type N-terminal cleavage/methylation domain-containing protein